MVKELGGGVLGRERGGGGWWGGGGGGQRKNKNAPVGPFMTALHGSAFLVLNELRFRNLNECDVHVPYLTN